MLEVVLPSFLSFQIKKLNPERWLALSKPVMKLALGLISPSCKHISLFHTVSVRNPARNWWHTQLVIEENLIKGLFKGAGKLRCKEDETLQVMRNGELLHS